MTRSGLEEYLGITPRQLQEDILALTGHPLGWTYYAYERTVALWVGWKVVASIDYSDNST